MLKLDASVAGLVLLSALLHASWNAVVKSDADRLMSFGLVMITGTAMGLAVAPFVRFPGWSAWPWLATSVVIHNFYYFFLLRADALGELSHVYPIARGSAPLLVAVSAWLLPPHEVLAGWQVAGVAAISTGILSLAVEKPLAGAHKWQPVVFGLMTGVSIMGYTLCDGLGIRHAGPGEAQQFGYIAWLFVLDAPLLVMFCIWRRGVAPALSYWSKSWPLGLAGGALSAGAYAIAIFAMRSGAFAHVSALRETSVIFAAILSALLLRERFHYRRYASVCLVALGAVLLH